VNKGTVPAFRHKNHVANPATIVYNRLNRSKRSQVIVNIYIKLKSIGKRKPVLINTPYNLPNDISTLRQLIQEIVRQEVETYNSRGIENMLIPFLTETEIAEQSVVGKVGFGRLYSDKHADIDKAIETALQGFEDGLFKVLVNNNEAMELDSPLEIFENDTLTFVRLTFLTGRLW
jgi:hypothetical protein